MSKIIKSNRQPITTMPTKDYDDYGKCFWRALPADCLCIRGLKSLPQSTAKLFARAARVSPYAGAHTQPVQTQPGG